MNENNDMNEMLEFRRIKGNAGKNAMTEKAAPCLNKWSLSWIRPGRRPPCRRRQRPGRFWILGTALFGYGRSKGSRPGGKSGKDADPGSAGERQAVCRTFPGG